MVIYERLLSGKRILSELLIFVNGLAFTRKILQYADSYHDLVSVLFTTLRLILFVGLHPVQKEYLFPAFDSGLTIGKLDNALRLDGIGGSHCRLILSTGIMILFRE